MPNKKPEQPSPLERYKKTIELIEAQRVFILLTGESVERVFDVLQLLREKEHLLVSIDFKIPGVKDKLKTLRRKGERCPGVYSVSTARDARTAINSGAEFVFTTHVDKGISKKCRREKIFHAAGALTPKEAYEAHNYGADALSLFPCSAMGGLNWLLRLKDMYPGFKLIPTDVMTPGEAQEYLKAGSYAVAPIIDTGKTEGVGDLIAGYID